jgi:predicted nicotinamide N-methyase
MQSPIEKLTSNFHFRSPKFVPEIKVLSAVNGLSSYPNVRHPDDVYGYVIPFWGGQLLARYILKNPDVVKGKRVLDFGCGTGQVGIAAAKSGAIVSCLDQDPMALEFAYKNAKHNDVKMDFIWGNENDLSDGYDVYLFADVFHLTVRQQLWNFAKSKKSLVSLADTKLMDVTGLTLKDSLSPREGKNIYLYSSLKD